MKLILPIIKHKLKDKENYDKNNKITINEIYYALVNTIMDKEPEQKEIKQSEQEEIIKCDEQEIGETQENVLNGYKIMKIILNMLYDYTNSTFKWIINKINDQMENISNLHSQFKKNNNNRKIISFNYFSIYT